MIAYRANFSKLIVVNIYLFLSSAGVLQEIWKLTKC